MSKEPLSDEERMVRAKRRFRESVIFGLVFGLIFSGAATLYTIADEHGMFLRLGFSHAQTGAAFPWIFGVVTGAFVVAVIVRYRQTKADRNPSYLRKDMDNIHRRWRWVMVILSFPLLLQAAHTLFTPQSFDAVAIAPQVLCLVLLATMVCFGPGWISKTYRETLNDELMRALRARAVRLGYLLLMPALGGLVFVIFYWPREALPAALAILCGGGVIPTLYLVLLEWRAEGGAEARDG